MIRVLSDIDGLAEELEALVEEGQASVARTMNFVVRSTAQRARNKIRSGPKTGRTYGSHQASAPGEAPADWTGYLASSISHTEITDNISSEAEVTVDATYADTLEFGGFNESGRYVEPRPFLYPSFMEALAEGEKVFDRELRKMAG